LRVEWEAREARSRFLDGRGKRSAAKRSRGRPFDQSSHLINQVGARTTTRAKKARSWLVLPSRKNDTTRKRGLRPFNATALFPEMGDKYP
jgi:hypothetical protein